METQVHLHHIAQLEPEAARILQQVSICWRAMVCDIAARAAAEEAWIHSREAGADPEHVSVTDRHVREATRAVYETVSDYEDLPPDVEAAMHSLARCLNR